MNNLRFLHFVTACYAIFLTLLLWLPNPKELFYGWQPSEQTSGYSHLITFMLLGFLVELGRRQQSQLFWIVLLILYAFFTEIIQELLPIRTFEWHDIIQDICGIMVGLGLAVFCRFVAVKIKK
jgi:glycopeptide antibiotics resistance protein